MVGGDKKFLQVKNIFEISQFEFIKDENLEQYQSLASICLLSIRINSETNILRKQYIS